MENGRVTVFGPFKREGNEKIDSIRGRDTRNEIIVVIKKCCKIIR